MSKDTTSLFLSFASMPPSPERSEHVDSPRVNDPNAGALRNGFQAQRQPVRGQGGAIHVRQLSQDM